MNLEQIQQQFSHSLIEGNRAPTNLAISGPAPAQQLLQLYRNNFVMSLTEMLEVVFPASYQLVGEEFFLQLCKSYILASPLQQAAIEQYGQNFAHFIDQCPQTDSLPYLADIARLEWHLEQAKAAQNQDAFPFQQLAEVPEQLQPCIRFQLATASHLIRSDYPIYSIWQAVQQQQFSGLDLNESERLMIVPGPSQSAEIVPLSEIQLRLLAAFREGKPLSTLVLPDDFEPLLRNWISTGIITGFSLTAEENEND